MHFFVICSQDINGKASETINIEQLFVPKYANDHFEDTGEKKLALVTGSCGSITISSVTVKFVEDMIEQYSKNIYNIDKLNKIFLNGYDKRISTYLCGKGVDPEISWIKPRNFDEPEIFKSNIDFKSCKNLN